MQKKPHNRFVLPLLGFCCLLANSKWAMAQDPLLFESDAVLELTMPVDFDALCRPSQDPDCDFTSTVFQYTDHAGEARTIPIGILRRDGWRAMQTNCQVPTLFVRFDESGTAGTPFAGQTTLALTSHCGKGISPENVPSRRLPDWFESYVGNEYLGYRLYNLVTEASLRVRLVEITYTHPGNPRLDFTRKAFFSEHFEDLARRLGAELLPAHSFDPARLDYRAADQLALFQYMIGNTDWSIENQDNIVLLRYPNGAHVPVLFDLDMSALVNAHYARPAASLPIKKVKQRYYMGYCHGDNDWEALFAKFHFLEESVMNILADAPGLGRGDRRMSGSYLDSFFSAIATPELRQSQIIDACQPLPPVP